MVNHTLAISRSIENPIFNTLRTGYVQGPGRKGVCMYVHMFVCVVCVCVCVCVCV